MPKMACIDCGAAEFEADSWQTMLVAMMPHYFESHHDVISGATEPSREGWMTRFMDAYRAASQRQKNEL